MSTTIRDELKRRGWTDADLSKPWRRDGYSVSPGRYIEDRDEWASKVVDLRHLLPIGAVVTMGPQSATVTEYAPGGGVRADTPHGVRTMSGSSTWGLIDLAITYPEN